MNFSRILIFLILLGIVGGGTYYYQLKHKPVSPFQTTVVQRGDILEDVSVTGRVNSEAMVDLAFERGGAVITDPLPVGTHVESGQVLATLNTNELDALRAQVKANIIFEQANLRELQKGSRPEDIAVSQAELGSAESAKVDSIRNIENQTEVAFTISDDAIHNTADQLFRNPRTSNPELTLTITDGKLAIALPQERVQIEKTLTTWSAEVKQGAASDTDRFIVDTESALGEIKSFMDLLAQGVNNLLPNSNTPQTTIDAWKVDISTARTQLNTALSNLRTAKASYRAAGEAVEVAHRALLLKTAGPTKESLDAQIAKISAAKANLANYDAQIATMSLRAPFSGVVSKQQTKRGALVSLGVPVISLISDGKWKIEANVPEADVAKIHLNDQAQITLDAYGSNTFFPATVAKIDPVETIIEGVSTYNVTLHFTEDDTRIRSGMTANITINTQKHTNVLMIPARAVNTEGGRSTVRIPSTDGLTANDQVVTTGLRGSNGMIEITSGLTEGATVVTFEEKP